MGLLNYSTRANLVANTPENIADVTDCLDKIRTSVNSVAEEQLEAALATKINAIAESQLGAALATKIAKLRTSTGIARSSSWPSLSGTYIDVPGATASFTLTYPSTVLVTTVFDYNLRPLATGAYNVRGEGALVVDGTPEALTAIGGVDMGMASSANVIDNLRFSATQVHRLSLSAAAHTLKLQVRSIGSSGFPNGSSSSAHFMYCVIPDA